MKSIPSLLRIAEHKALSGLNLSGEVLDLGGEKHSEYLSLIKGDFNVTILNNDPVAKADITHDLEESLPIAASSYDHILLINVLEHIFNYKELLQESRRVLKPSGTLNIVVPFLFPVHPSPHDYRRFTGETLEKELEISGFTDIEITPLGSGVFSARYLLLDRLLPWPIRLFNHYVTRYLILFYDFLWQWLASHFGRQYRYVDYPLGYLATCKRPV